MVLSGSLANATGIRLYKVSADYSTITTVLSESGVQFSAIDERQGYQMSGTEEVEEGDFLFAVLRHNTNTTTLAMNNLDLEDYKMSYELEQYIEKTWSI